MPAKNKVVSGEQPLYAYTWGPGCRAAVLSADHLSVKQETIPAGSGEQLHYHNRAVQFFYILKGTATFEIDQVSFQLQQREGIEIQAGQKHRICNEHEELLEFIVYSQPSTEKDRVNL
ncbi:cupin [Niabella ginsenosidivorans]|uniref:Cupin n=1 Tax=Niabella ginsenosidivorans TaxID=1176587 RepID=A0A1A9I6B6_9BACT|nr:cupin domain-containing protein [Niabella ginsenosidivorans]ANH82250.1 cupin [Niabella ginsenosidivorans]